MASAIDPTKPVEGNPTTQSVRDNFTAAKAEIEALQAAQTAAATFSEVTRTSDTSIGTGSPERMTFPTVVKDPLSMWDAASNQYIIPDGMAGLWRVGFMEHLTTTNAAQVVYAWILINGNPDGASRAAAFAQSQNAGDMVGLGNGGVILEINEGDGVSINLYGGQGTNKGFGRNGNNYFQMQYLGPA